MRTFHTLMIVLAAGVWGGTSEARAEGAPPVVIETVTVGNPGNAGDFQSEGTFGAVDYVYAIGKYEVTAGQYAAFLNAVAATDAYAYWGLTLLNASARPIDMHSSDQFSDLGFRVATLAGTSQPSCDLPVDHPD